MPTGLNEKKRENNKIKDFLCYFLGDQYDVVTSLLLFIYFLEQLALFLINERKMEGPFVDLFIRKNK